MNYSFILKALYCPDLPPIFPPNLAAVNHVITSPFITKCLEPKIVPVDPEGGLRSTPLQRLLIGLSSSYLLGNKLPTLSQPLCVKISFGEPLKRWTYIVQLSTSISVFSAGFMYQFPECAFEIWPIHNAVRHKEIALERAFFVVY